MGLDQFLKSASAVSAQKSSLCSTDRATLWKDQTDRPGYGVSELFNDQRSGPSRSTEPVIAMGLPEKVCAHVCLMVQTNTAKKGSSSGRPVQRDPGMVESR